MGQGSPDNDRGYCAGAPCAFAQPPSECLANKRKPLGPPVTKRGACFCVRIRGSGEEPGANDRKPGQARGFPESGTQAQDCKAGGRTPPVTPKAPGEAAQLQPHRLTNPYKLLYRARRQVNLFAAAPLCSPSPGCVSPGLLPRGRDSKCRDGCKWHGSAGLRSLHNFFARVVLWRA